METTKDEVTITIKLSRNINGTCSRSHLIEGEGFHMFEIIGLLNMVCYDFANDSKQLAKDLPTDKEQRIIYDTPKEKL